jgi:hypothetical protein
LAQKQKITPEESSEFAIDKKKIPSKRKMKKKLKDGGIQKDILIAIRPGEEPRTKSRW